MTKNLLSLIQLLIILYGEYVNKRSVIQRHIPEVYLLWYFALMAIIASQRLTNHRKQSLVCDMKDKLIVTSGYPDGVIYGMVG